MKTKIQMWGNSLGVRIPKHIAQTLKLQKGKEVSISLEKGLIEITPIKPRYQLKDLVAGITDKNRHKEALTDGSAGKEIW